MVSISIRSLLTFSYLDCLLYLDYQVSLWKGALPFVKVLRTVAELPAMEMMVSAAEQVEVVPLAAPETQLACSLIALLVQEFSQREWNDFAPRVSPAELVEVVPLAASEIQLVYSLRTLSVQEFSLRE